MPITTKSCFPHLAALALAMGLGGLNARAQDPAPAASPPAASDDTVTIDAPANSPDSLATAARNILELVEVHSFRMRRIDEAIQYYSSIDDQDKVRQFMLMRERETNSYQQSLETYRRLLGDADFTRVAGLLRNHFNKLDRLANAERDPDPDRSRPRADRGDRSDESAAERAERVRRMMAAQAAEARQRQAERAALERSQLVERMRASQRAQLAQRLAQARAEQLQQRAAAQQRYAVTPEPAANRRADPAQGGMPFGRGRGAGRGQNPWQQPQRP
jgi:hypothetical protein